MHRTSGSQSLAIHTFLGGELIRCSKINGLFDVVHILDPHLLIVLPIHDVLVGEALLDFVNMLRCKGTLGDSTSVSFQEKLG